MKEFLNPKECLGDLNAVAVSALLAAASDIVLVVDRDGTVRDLAFHTDDLDPAFEDCGTWVGRPWADSVTAESRPKIARLLRTLTEKAPARRLQLNYPSRGGGEIPVTYSALRIGDDARIIAFGRDLRAVSTMQQRLVDAQQSMERDYLKLRHVETRYRLLLDTSSEPVLILDVASRKATEVNPAARALLGTTAKHVLSRPFTDIFTTESAEQVQELFGAVRTAGRADDVLAVLAADRREVRVSAVLFRQEHASLFLVRLMPVAGAAQSTGPAVPSSKLLLAVENAPDGFVVTGTDGAVLAANAAFLEMAQVDSEEQARGATLDQWLGRSGIDLDVLLSNLRQRGSVRLFATTLRGQHGSNAEVEISAASVLNGGHGFYGFAIRNVGRRLPADSRTGRKLPRSVEQLTELIGRVSLKELVREATDMIERLGIEAALELTGDNRASAAELLGLSRQSLYVKLRRYGLGDLSSESENPA